jgi:hypothetical protein
MGRISTEDTFRVLLSGAADPDRPIGVRSSFIDGRGAGLGHLTESGLAPLLDPVIVKVTLLAALALTVSTVTLRAVTLTVVASLALALLAFSIVALALLFIPLTLLLLLVLVLLTSTYYLDLLAGLLVLLRSWLSSPPQ